MPVHVEQADGHKCDRCWRYVPEVGQDAGSVRDSAPRCVEALAEPVSL